MHKLLTILCIMTLGVIALGAFCLSCDSPDRATMTLRQAGYTDIRTTGWDPFSCGEDDMFTTGFTATNPRGDTVSGVVCCGLWKGCTVRF